MRRKPDEHHFYPPSTRTAIPASYMSVLRSKVASLGIVLASFSSALTGCAGNQKPPVVAPAALSDGTISPSGLDLNTEADSVNPDIPKQGVRPKRKYATFEPVRYIWIPPLFPLYGVHPENISFDGVAFLKLMRQLEYNFSTDDLPDISEAIDVIIPSTRYSFALFLSKSYIKLKVPTLSGRLKNREDPFALSFKEAASYLPKIGSQRQMNEALLDFYCEKFGGSVDFSKTAFLFPPEYKINLPTSDSLANTHPDAIDVFYPVLGVEGNNQIGPPVQAIASGVVLIAENGWQGDTTELGYKGGGISSLGGNGVLIYNPKIKQYYYYAHLFNVIVKKGDIVEAGQILGKGGNTGKDAQKSCCGRHVHLEIHRYDSKNEMEYVPSAQLLKFLQSSK